MVAGCMFSFSCPESYNTWTFASGFHEAQGLGVHPCAASISNSSLLMSLALECMKIPQLKKISLLVDRLMDYF